MPLVEEKSQEFGEYIHGIAKAEGSVRVWICYGPILPDPETKDELNFLLKQQQFSSSVRGTVLPQKKEIRQLKFSPQTLILEGKDDFKVSIECKNIVKIENSLSDAKAIKLKSVSESSHRVKLRPENGISEPSIEEPIFDPMHELGYR